MLWHWIKRNIFRIDPAKLFANRARYFARAGNDMIFLHRKSCRGGEPSWPEMADHNFRRKVLTLLHKDRYVANPTFVGPDGYDEDWMFSAIQRPATIQPGNCLVCNHPYVRNGQCENISCLADQTIRLWLRSPSHQMHTDQMA